MRVYPLQLAQFARQNRSRLTVSEALLWAALKNRQLGVQFRRQALWPSASSWTSALLVVEVNGAYHARRRGADKRRDAVIRALGYRVVRLDARLVLRNLAAALALVREAT